MCTLGYEIVHPVDGLQKGGLPEPGGTDERRYPVRHDVERFVFQRVEIVIGEVEALRLNLNIRFSEVLLVLSDVNRDIHFPSLTSSIHPSYPSFR